MADGRAIVQQKEEDTVAKARRVVEAADVRARNRVKKTYSEAAKLARKWRLDGRLAPASIHEADKPVRLLRRF